MKVLYLASLLFLGVAFARNIADNDSANKVDDSSSEELFTIDANTTEKISAKCKEVGGEAAAKKFQVALQSTVSCLNSQAPKNKEELKLEVTGEETKICSKRRKSIRGCFNELIEAAKDCSVEQEKYAPEFAFDALDALLDYFCANDGKVLQDLFNSNQTWTCGSHVLEKAIAGNLTYVCTNNFKLLHDTEDNIITKPELCEDLHTAKNCYSEFLTKECPDAKELNLFLVGVFDAFSSPCKSIKTKRQLIEMDIM